MQKPRLVVMAEQVIKSVDQRSRLARRHARQLAQEVLLGAESHADGADPWRGLVKGRRDETTTGFDVEPVGRHWLPVAAEFAVIAAEQPDVAESLLSFAGAA